ncbi:hypothetical protein E5D57_007539 [Metarhizium anisopliae]|nr:hypothetical protein E5D57_007539 [Metarhizium anisopliae]
MARISTFSTTLTKEPNNRLLAHDSAETDQSCVNDRYGNREPRARKLFSEESYGSYRDVRYLIH